jgi:NAD(P)H-hydrate epimerase
MKAMSTGALPQVAARDLPAATAEQMAEVDRIASSELGVTLETLMENACRQIAAATALSLDGAKGKRIVAVCGTGNNGGDALGALRHLRAEGADVEAFVAAPRGALSVLARRQHDALVRLGVPVRDTTMITDYDFIQRNKNVDAVIDGLLGYSTRGAPRGEIARLILITSAARGNGLRPIVAVDLPSGIDPDTGEKLSAVPAGAIPATLTVTLGLPKRGLLREPARRWIGELVVADIGIPPEAFVRVGIDARGLFARGDLLRVAF